MCKPCKAELKKYQTGGFTKDGSVAEGDPIASGEFKMSQFLNELGNAGTAEGTQEGMDNREAALESTLEREKARVKRVIANVSGTTKKMSEVSADISDYDSTSDANRQWGELGRAPYNMGERRNYVDSITKYGTIDPNLDYLMPDNPNGTPFTMVNYDPAADDENATSGYDADRSLSCIGSTCGAFQEAEKGTGGGGTKTHMYASNMKFRNATRAGNTNFSEIPIGDVQAGDVVQNRDWQSVDYNDSSKGKQYRAHHAGIVESVDDEIASTVNRDGDVNENSGQPVVNAYNAINGQLDNYALSNNFGSLRKGKTEEQYAYRFTGDVPQDQAAVNNFRGGPTNAFNYLQYVQEQNQYKADNPPIKALPMQPIPRIESGVSPGLVAKEREVPKAPRRKLFEKWR